MAIYRTKEQNSRCLVENLKQINGSHPLIKCF